MLNIEETQELLSAVAERRLQLRDLAVLMAVLGHVNWRSGRANVSVRSLAKLINVAESNCSSSIKRLRAEALIARGVDRQSNHSFFMLNPRLSWVGSTQRRGHLYKQWDELTKIPKLDELDEAG